jgi:hypothetical protein
VDWFRSFNAIPQLIHRGRDRGRIAEQSLWVDQVNTAVTQTDRVIQTNSAQNEELSATAPSLVEHSSRLAGSPASSWGITTLGWPAVRAVRQRWRFESPNPASCRPDSTVFIPGAERSSSSS